jgi:hypothetical protein
LLLQVAFFFLFSWGEYKKLLLSNYICVDASSVWNIANFLLSFFFFWFFFLAVRVFVFTIQREMTQKNIAFQLSPEVMAHNCCALCANVLVPGTGGEVTSNCGHKSHAECFADAARSHENVACQHCGNLVISCPSVPPQQQQDDDPVSEVDGDEYYSEDDTNDVFDPFTTQLEIAQDPDNLISQLFSVGLNLDDIREKKSAQTLEDLIVQGFVAPHLTMEVNGKHVATISQLLKFDGVDADSLRDALGLDMKALVTLGATSEEFTALGYQVIEEDAAAAAAAVNGKPRFSTPYGFSGGAAAAASATVPDPDFEKEIIRSFEERKKTIRFVPPPSASKSDVELVAVDEYQQQQQQQQQMLEAGDHMNGSSPTNHIDGDGDDDGDDQYDTFDGGEGYYDDFDDQVAEEIVVPYGSFTAAVAAFSAKGRINSSLSDVRPVLETRSCSMSAQPSSSARVDPLCAARQDYNNQRFSVAAAAATTSSSVPSNFAKAIAGVKLL